MTENASAARSTSARNATRTHQEDFPVDDIIVRPEENYRWGSHEAMEQDINNESLDGSSEVSNSYQTLRSSIRASGVKDPIGLVQRKDGYHVIYGFTRCIAAKDIGLKAVPAYVYDSAITAAQIKLLQLQENSAHLKRAVNWINEVEMFHQLVDEYEQFYTEMPTASRPLDEKGKPMQPRSLALRDVKSAGHKPGPLGNQRNVLKHLHPKVVELTRRHNWSFPTSVEFYSGQADCPFSGDFITKVVAEMKRNDPKFVRVTPEVVRQTRKRIGSGFKMVYAAGKQPTTIEAVARLGGDDRRLSPGAARDACVDMAGAWMSANKVTGQATDALKAETFRTSAVWHQIIGIGMCSGEVALPACAVGRALANEIESKNETITPGAEPAVLDQQHRNASERWAINVTLQALLRNELARRVGDVHAWMGSYSEVDGTRTAHRRAFCQAINEALTWSDEARAPEGLVAMFKRALTELLDRVPVTTGKVRRTA